MGLVESGVVPPHRVNTTTYIYGGRLLRNKMNCVAKEQEMEDNKGTREWMEGAEGEEMSRRGHWRSDRCGKEGAAPRGREERRKAEP